MTPERAITFMSFIKRTFEKYFSDPYGEAQAAFDIAIEAIKKHEIQVQRNVLTFDNTVNVSAAKIRAGAKVYKCPKCGTFVLQSHRYCFYCGQVFEEVNYVKRI